MGLVVIFDDSFGAISWLPTTLDLCVDVHTGKDWAKGLTAATDPRVARAAAAHRGKVYQRRKPFEECRWPIGDQTTLPLTWSDEMAYIVGLTATDGCLVTGRRVINFKSEDRQLVETYLSVLGRANRIRAEKTHKPNGVVYATQFGDSRLYEWFRSVGLTPRKSLTLGSICMPDRFIVPLARGLMDGDGGIANFVHAPTVATYPTYMYERLIVSFNSASRPHLEWLRVQLERTIGERGSLNVLRRKDRRDMFVFSTESTKASNCCSSSTRTRTHRGWCGSGESGTRIFYGRRTHVSMSEAIARIVSLAEVVKR